MKILYSCFLLTALFCFSFSTSSNAQDDAYLDARNEAIIQAQYQQAKPFFERAYQQFPSVPRGVLEAVSFTNTHFRHITTQTDPESCTGMPLALGVMGLIQDGKGYFRNNLALVAHLSGYPANRIVSDPETNILAYARAYETLQAQKRLTGRSVADQLPILIELSELPDENIQQNFALNSFLYAVCDFMESAGRQQMCGFTSPGLDMEKVFGRENLRILSAPHVVLTRSGVQDKSGRKFSRKSLLPGGGKSSDYAPALWDQACTSNYSSRNGTAISAITLHTVQGSYAGCISWFNNCSASVSAHYVLRSSDGQVTQMVLEADKAWHVGTENPYTIGYEHEGYITDPSYYTTAMYTSSANLTKDICASGYGIDPKRCFWGPATSGQYVVNCPKIKGHQNYPNQTHTDPGINWDWNYYYKLVNSARTPVTYTASSGTLYDSGGASGDYANNEGGLWLIQPAGAASVTVNFTSFSVEADWDYMYIYDGSTVYSPVIGVYTGTTSPGTVTATSGAMLIEFRSDCATVGSGWAANYTSSTGTTNPTSLSTNQAACPSNDVTFSWTNSGTGWYIALSTDPTFTTYYWKWVSGMTSYTGFAGFVDHVDGVTPCTFQPGTTYYWYMRANGTNFPGPSFTTHTCAAPTPSGMTVTAPTCSNQNATLSWTNSGSNWTMEISTDSTFTSKSSKAIPSLTTTTAPAGFSPAFTFHHDTKYFWRIFNGTVYTSGPSFISPMCDTIAPTSAISINGTWQTTDFDVSFTDEDDAEGTGIEKGYYQVLDFDGSEWHANAELGFFADNYDVSIGSEYTLPAGGGTWGVSGGFLNQTDAVNTNTNIYTTLKQDLSNRYLYNFRYRMNSASGNRRFGFHFFADSATAVNRGNSYFIWFRANTTTGSNTLEFYKCHWDNDTNNFDQVKVIDPVPTTTGQWYDVKVIYDRITGEIAVYRDDEFLGSYTDAAPLATGKYISFRTGACDMSFDELKIYRSRYPDVTVTVGAGNTHMARYQNPDPATFAAKVKSITEDFAGNLSEVSYSNVNIDWTAPGSITGLSDGVSSDIDTITTQSLSANWSAGSDPHSGIAGYYYCVGTTAGDSNVIAWTSCGMSTSVTNNSVTLTDGQLYYFSVKAVNGAGLYSVPATSDGQRYLDVTGIKETPDQSVISLMPNPLHGETTLTLALEKAARTDLAIYDVTGRCVYQYTPGLLPAGVQKIQLPLENLSSGTYSLMITAGDRRMMQQLVVY